MTTTKLADANVTTVKLADASVTDIKVANGISYSKLSGAPTSLPPSGAASGDLSGSYPAPTVATSAITTAKIADANVTTVKLADASVTDIKVANGISYSKLSGAPTSLPPSGAASGDLSGSYPAPTVATSAITTAKIADANVTTAKLADGAVTAAKMNSNGASAGQVLEWSGTAWVPTTPGGLNYFNEARNTTIPNNTQPVHQLIVNGSDVAIDAVVSPKGVGAFCLDVADNSFTGGNKRGLYAVDLQRVRSTGGQVASGSYATVLGGSSNTASGNYASIAGGASNSAGYCGSVAGGSGNNSSGNYSGVLSGVNNSAAGAGGVVAGGEQCSASGLRSSITGGYGNIANIEGAHVGGGSFNSATNLNSVVSGGHFNIASSTRSAVGGGLSNLASGDASVIAGGSYNIASGGVSSVQGGSNNIASGFASTVGGGSQDTASGVGAVVSGGQFSKASGSNSTVGGGYLNSASGNNATISGGYNNKALASYSAVGGGLSNNSYSDYTTVAGGNDNSASSLYSAVLGGMSNSAVALGSAILGGQTNTAQGTCSSVGGGGGNNVFGNYSCIASGLSNIVQGTNSAVLSGGSNAVSSGTVYSAVLSGQLNDAHSSYSCILGGSSNTTDASYQLIFGNGVTPTGNEPYRVYFFDGTSFSGMISVNRLNADYPIHVGTNNTNGNGAFLSAGGVWTNGSSRTFKDRYTTLDSADVLRKVRDMDLRGWWYKNTHEYHIGPFAEDFRENFGTGVLDNETSNKYLAATDVAGVALYTGQQLIKSSEDQQRRIAELEDRLAKLEAQRNAQSSEVPSTAQALSADQPTTSALRILSIVPNPASSSVVIRFHTDASTTVSVHLLRGTGEHLITVMPDVFLKASDYEVEVNVQDYANGWYVVSLESPSGAAQRLVRVLH